MASVTANIPSQASIEPPAPQDVALGNTAGLDKQSFLDKGMKFDEVDALFKKFDSNKDNKLSPQEIEKILSEWSAPQAAAAQQAASQQGQGGCGGGSGDSGGGSGGGCGQGAAQPAGNSGTSGASSLMEDLLKTWFATQLQKADENKDGKVSKSEAKKHLNMSEAQFAKADTNGDGALTQTEITASASVPSSAPVGSPAIAFA